MAINIHVHIEKITNVPVTWFALFQRYASSVLHFDTSNTRFPFKEGFNFQRKTPSLKSTGKLAVYTCVRMRACVYACKG